MRSSNKISSQQVHWQLRGVYFDSAENKENLVIGIFIPVCMNRFPVIINSGHIFKMMNESYHWGYIFWSFLKLSFYFCFFLFL